MVSGRCYFGQDLVQVVSADLESFETPDLERCTARLRSPFLRGLVPIAASWPGFGPPPDGTPLAKDDDAAMSGMPDADHAKSGVKLTYDDYGDGLSTTGT